MTTFSNKGLVYQNYVSAADTSASSPNYYDLTLGTTEGTYQVWLWYECGGDMTAFADVASFEFLDGTTVLKQTWISNAMYSTNSTSLTSDENTSTTSACPFFSGLLTQTTDGPHAVELLIRSNATRSTVSGKGTAQASTNNYFIISEFACTINETGSLYPKIMRIHSANNSPASLNWFSSLVASSYSIS